MNNILIQQHIFGFKIKLELLLVFHNCFFKFVKWFDFKVSSTRWQHSTVSLAHLFTRLYKATVRKVKPQIYVLVPKYANCVHRCVCGLYRCICAQAFITVKRIQLRVNIPLFWNEWQTFWKSAAAWIVSNVAISDFFYYL